MLEMCCVHCPHMIEIPATIDADGKNDYNLRVGDKITCPRCGGVNRVYEDQIGDDIYFLFERQTNDNG